MTRWKMVPVELTPGMRNAWFDGSYEDLIAAAPEWEPSDEDCTRALDAMTAHRDQPPTPIEMMRAALKAAFGGES